MASNEPPGLAPDPCNRFPISFSLRALLEVGGVHVRWCPLVPVPAVEGVEDVDAAFFLAAADEFLPGCLRPLPDVGVVLVQGLNRSSSSGSDLSS